MKRKRGVRQRGELSERLESRPGHGTKRWNQIIETQITMLAQQMVPHDEAPGAAPSQLEKMMRTPPPHDLASDEVDFDLSQDDIKRSMRAWPPAAHAHLGELAKRCGHVYDAEALKQRDDYSPPGIVLRVAHTRIKVRQEAQDWTGCESNGQLSGRMLGFFTQVRDQIHNGHRAFEEFVTLDQLRSEPEKKIVLKCLEAE